MLYLLCVAFGGAMGAILRYCVKLILGNTAFPFATLTVNLLGCFLMGLLGGVSKGANKSFFLVGVLGAFTTFSSFGLETVELFNKGNYGACIVNILLNNVFGLVLVYIGFRLGNLLIKQI